MAKAKYYVVTYEDGKLWIDGIRRKNPAPDLLALMKTRWRAGEGRHYT